MNQSQIVKVLLVMPFLFVSCNTEKEVKTTSHSKVSVVSAKTAAPVSKVNEKPKDNKPEITCLKEEAMTIGGGTVWRIPSVEGFFFESGMMIDADGAPNAYHSDGGALDYLGNAGKPGNWWALVTAENGSPVVQGLDDPFPGYYISKTALEDKTKDKTDPTRYINSDTVPYIVLPSRMGLGAKLGDMGVAINKNTKAFSYAIFADIGPRNKLGEGSIALARELGVPSDPKKGGTLSGIIYVVFPGSGNRKPRSEKEITDIARKEFKKFGDMKRIKKCL
jgi:Fungal chitosanase of glycosyl hydrolase group 75